MKLVILLFSISDFTDHFSSTNIISLSPSHTDNSKLLYYYIITLIYIRYSSDR